MSPLVQRILLRAPGHDCPSLKLRPHCLKAAPREATVARRLDQIEQIVLSLYTIQTGRQSTEICLRAEPTEKLEALAVMTPPALKRGRVRTPYKLLAMLKDTLRTKNYVE